jgi:hypothetical protein
VEHRDGTVEEISAELAYSAHGLVTRRELLKAKVTREEIRSRLASGALILEYRGVYRVGHPDAPPDTCSSSSRVRSRRRTSSRPPNGALKV